MQSYAGTEVGALAQYREGMNNKSDWQRMVHPGCRDHGVHHHQDNRQSLRDRFDGHQSRVQEAVWTVPLLRVRGQFIHPDTDLQSLHITINEYG